MHLATLDPLYKRNHTIFVHLWLIYFTWHDIFRVHPCHSMYQNFIFKKLNRIPGTYYVLFIHSHTDGSDPFFINSQYLHVKMTLSLRVEHLGNYTCVMGWIMLPPNSNPDSHHGCPWRLAHKEVILSKWTTRVALIQSEKWVSLWKEER